MCVVQNERAGRFAQYELFQLGIVWITSDGNSDLVLLMGQDGSTPRDMKSAQSLGLVLSVVGRATAFPCWGWQARDLTIDFDHVILKSPV